MNNTSRWGDFSIFGLSKDAPEYVEHGLPDRLGVKPRIIDFGSGGHFFFYTNNGEVAESADVITLKIGSIRSTAMVSLSAQALLD